MGKVGTESIKFCSLPYRQQSHLVLSNTAPPDYKPGGADAYRAYEEPTWGK
ncbi:hypothetical protein TUM17577_23770 [Enterobacter asburiae]|nr:hypothetical protein TUM17577_23770 [Enterobacter asburiae]